MLKESGPFLRHCEYPSFLGPPWLGLTRALTSATLFNSSKCFNFVYLHDWFQVEGEFLSFYAVSVGGVNFLLCANNGISTHPEIQTAKSRYSCEAQRRTMKKKERM